MLQVGRRTEVRRDSLAKFNQPAERKSLLEKGGGRRPFANRTTQVTVSRIPATRKRSLDFAERGEKCTRGTRISQRQVPIRRYDLHAQHNRADPRSGVQYQRQCLNYSKPSLRIREFAVSVFPPRNHGAASQLTSLNGTDVVTVMGSPARAAVGSGVTLTVTPGTATLAE